MARPVIVTTFVPAPPDEVFAFVADTRNDPVWCANVTDVTQVAGDGVSVGARFRFHQAVKTGGRTIDSDVDVEVVGLSDRSIEWRVEDRFQIREITLSVEPRAEGSTVRQQTLAAFKRDPGLARWLYPFLARRTFRDQFSRLAEHFTSTD
ncbi:MAG TPA: SRPBCC family protein [Acidimicrobiia bacterium]